MLMRELVPGRFQESRRRPRHRGRCRRLHRYEQKNGGRFSSANSRPNCAYLCLMNEPFLSSLKACCNSDFVFITIGPYQATGSSSGRPDTSRNLIPSSPAVTVISSPLSNSTSERLPSIDGVGSSDTPTCSVCTGRGFDESRKVPD